MRRSHPLTHRRMRASQKTSLRAEQSTTCFSPDTSAVSGGPPVPSKHLQVTDDAISSSDISQTPFPEAPSLAARRGSGAS
jgi:hypothetical protein